MLLTATRRDGPTRPGFRAPFRLRGANDGAVLLGQTRLRLP